MRGGYCNVHVKHYFLAGHLCLTLWHRYNDMLHASDQHLAISRGEGAVQNSAKLALQALKVTELLVQNHMASNVLVSCAT